MTVLAAAVVAVTGPAAAQAPLVGSEKHAVPVEPQLLALPTPFQFVSNVDLECFRTSPYTPPLTTAIVTRHLNPVLSTLPVENNPVGPREKLCVPVAKNGVIPPPGVLDFVRFVDLSCYRTTGINVNRPLNLRQLNPVLAAVSYTHLTLPTILRV